MNFIVFDLELTCWEGDSAGRPQEIIEIGAYKINPKAQTKSSFSRFVKPILYPILSPYCVNLTSIRQDEINRAKSFKHVVEEFKNWIDDYEPYHLIAWGHQDLKSLKLDCQLHLLEDDWIKEYTDLNQQYQRIKKLRDPLALKHVLQKEGFEFDGIQHRAIDDAFNLSRIFMKYLDDWQLYKR